MAEVVQQQILPAPFIEAAAKPYLQELTTAVGGLKAADLSKSLGSQFIAGQDPLQAQAQTLATQGIGAYQPFLTSAAASAGPTAYQQFMSPYQQDIIDTTLQQFDVQAQKGLPGLAAQATASGNLGGGREGVQLAEYQATSDRNRAALQAQLLGQGFGQAQQQAGLDFNRNLNLAQQSPALLGQQIASLTTLGGQQQARQQQQLSAQQQLDQRTAFQPLEAAERLGGGVTQLIAGYPGGEKTMTSPSPTALQTGLSTGATLAGIYRLIQGN